MIDVELFEMKGLHDAWGIDTPKEPVTEISDEVARLRFKLYLEELSEFAHAMGKSKLLAFEMDNFAAKAHKDNNTGYDKVEVLDAMVDMHVIHSGTALILGLKDYMQAGWDEVYKSNASKLGEDGKAIRSDGTDGYPKGKILKGPNYVAPDLKKVFENK
jgi:predicted HAD superfamily Cof-like phosphohydrolase